MSRMPIGQLGLPVIDCETATSADYSFSTRTYLTFVEIAKNHPLGQEKLKQLASDHRVASLQAEYEEEKLMPLENERLAAWWLWRANQVGRDNAEQEINTYLNDEEIDCIYVTWIYGVQPTSTFVLASNVDVVPIDEMNDCDEKEAIYRQRNRFDKNTTFQFSGALRSFVRVPRVLSPIEHRQSLHDASLMHHNIALLLNCLPGLSCATGYQTFYEPDSVPVGPLSRRRGGSIVRGVLPLRTTKLESTPGDEIETLLQGFSRLNEKWKPRVRRALHRLAQAKGRLDQADRALDLGISLEMVLLGAEHNKQELPGQLHNHFRMRGAWLCGKDLNERKELYRNLGRIYSMRSEVAHNGTLLSIEKLGHERREEEFRMSTSVAERIFAALLKEGPPEDWSHIVLGGGSM